MSDTTQQLLIGVLVITLGGLVILGVRMTQTVRHKRRHDRRVEHDNQMLQIWTEAEQAHESDPKDDEQS